MPSAAVPLLTQQQSGLEALAGASPAAFNVVTDSRGTVRRRPGVATYSEAPTGPVDANGVAGIHCSAGGRLYVVAHGTPDRPIYRVGSGAATKLGGADGRTGVRGARRPTFAETEMLLVIAGGDEMQKVALATDTTDRLGGTGQPKASHVIANASRLLANQLEVYRGRVHYSDIATGALSYAGHEVWSYGVGTAGFVTQEARPDPVVALAENTNEIWVWGSQTLQLFAADPSTVYAPVAVLEHGCSAPGSVVKVDGSFAWMDDRRRIVLSNGRSLDVLSEAVQTQLGQLSDIENCYGWRVITGRTDALCWTFPGDGVTYVWQKGAGWGQWQGRARGNWAALDVTAHHLRRDTNVNVVGTSTGYLARLDDTAGSDLGEPVVAEVVSGFVDRASDNRKHCQGIRVVMRRDNHLGEAGSLLVTYRDGPQAPWEPDLTVDLGTDVAPVVEFNSLGVYRHRQWRFRFSGSGDLALVAVTERYEVQEDS